MFERFTERARRVVVGAQEAARELGHNYIGTEHLLIGLTWEEEALAAQILKRFNVTRPDVTDAVITIIGRTPARITNQIPFTPRSKKVLELALREALSLGHNYIGTEHILLAMVRENEGVGARILRDFDADSETVRNEVIRALNGPPRGPRRGASEQLAIVIENPFRAFTPEQRHLLTCALAGNYPASLEQHRGDVIRLLATADREHALGVLADLRA